MDAIKAIKTRRSIRKYKKKKVPVKLIKELVIAGLHAPSAFNSQPWVFITTTKQSVKDAIAKHKSQKSQFIKEAPVLMACCYDKNLAKESSHNLENVAVAVENILIAANALGLGTCYIGAFDPNYPGIEKSINRAFKLKKNEKVVALITIGYPDLKPNKKKLRKISEVWKRLG
jgi:nitroreductase